MTDGGDTSFGYRMSKEAIAKNKATKIKNGTYQIGTFKGRNHTKEAKEKNRQAHLGKPSGRKGSKASPEAIEKNRQKQLGKIPSEQTKKKRSETLLRNNKLGQAVLQFDLQGNFVKEFQSISRANIEVGGGIFACLKKKAYSAQSSLWIYKKVFDETLDKNSLIANLVEKAKPKPVWNKGLKNPDLSLRRSKRVHQLDSTTFEIIKSFDRIGDAETFIGKKGVWQSINKNICCGGYKWKYA